MKITINGSPKELAELTRVLNGTETEAKKADSSPLLTELTNDEKINELAGDIQSALDKISERTISHFLTSPLTTYTTRGGENQ